MADIELPDELIALRRRAVEARTEALAGPYSTERWRPWVEAADAFQAAVTAHAAAAGLSRYDVEMAAKSRVPYPAEG